MGNFSYKLYRLFLSLHSFSVTFFTLGSRLFFYSAANKLDLRGQKGSMQWKDSKDVLVKQKQLGELP